MICGYTLVHEERRVDLALDLDVNQHADAWIAKHFHAGVCYEPEVAHVMMRTLRKGDKAIDVGANVGFFTVLMSKLVGSCGKVLAFEPGTNVLPSLRKNLSLNSCSNVEVITRPLWHCEEKRTFHLSADSSGGNAMWPPENWIENVRTKAHPMSYEIETCTLDTAVRELAFSDVRLVKLDTEGADETILRGAEQFLTTEPAEYVLAELNPFGQQQLGTSNSSFREFMYEFGYELFLVHPDGSLPTLVPSRTTVTHDNNGIAVLNVLFSTLDAVGEAWSRAPYET